MVAPRKSTLLLLGIIFLVGTHSQAAPNSTSFVSQRRLEDKGGEEAKEIAAFRDAVINAYERELCELSIDPARDPTQPGTELQRKDHLPNHGDVCRNSRGGFYCPFMGRENLHCQHTMGQAPYCVMEVSNSKGQVKTRPCRPKPPSEARVMFESRKLWRAAKHESQAQARRQRSGKLGGHLLPPEPRDATDGGGGLAGGGQAPGVAGVSTGGLRTSMGEKLREKRRHRHERREEKKELKKMAVVGLPGMKPAKEAKREKKRESKEDRAHRRKEARYAERQAAAGAEAEAEAETYTQPQSSQALASSAGESETAASLALADRAAAKEVARMARAVKAAHGGAGGSHSGGVTDGRATEGAEEARRAAKREARQRRVVGLPGMAKQK
mmetsp:Transcript_41368/g.93191  ORF Transcript_41368/g.93191 Transcript_41368/m.93191 type:complete len:384 (+) Transcript_41368:151-1302(+)|eukprot:CAMPEP_0172616388 /NCGR_PEP_ID=MMETSP1068-20121228/64107_1 /TAXON_ID=35684 /ORGANISM="Pseudopedinella elastica, Strain CCMP716" /LENGTH=383 /DNA_ID=CAMNT_0013421797 /DNA_START=149 /DNA_END=1300 /DNA_ORIENTATION=+